MSSSSPVCYLSLTISDADWEGPRGGPQWVIRDRWTLEVEPQAAGGWRWRLLEDAAAAETVKASGVVTLTSAEAEDAEASAKQCVVEAWERARD